MQANNVKLTPYLYSMIQLQSNGCSEKEIETELYGYLLQHFTGEIQRRGDIGTVLYRNPHNIDGLLTISTLQEDRAILIETKTHHSLSTTGIWTPLSQALQYTHLLHHLGGLIPSVILIATEREWNAVQVDGLAPILSRSDLPWEATPSERSPEIESALQELRPKIIHHLLMPLLPMATAVGDLTNALYSSNYRSVKIPQGLSDTSAVSVDFNEEEYLYHEGSRHWYMYHPLTGIWERSQRQQVLARLTLEATKPELPLKARRAIAVSTLESLKGTRAIEEWPRETGLINLPSGSWADGVISKHSPDQYHRLIMGVDPMDTRGSMEGSNLDLALSFAVSNLASPPSETRILTVYLLPRELELLMEVMGSYAKRVGAATLLSSGSRASRVEEPPVLIADVSDLEPTGVMRAVNRTMESERFSSSVIILIAGEEQIAAVGAPLTSLGVEVARHREPRGVELEPGELLYMAMNGEKIMRDTLEGDRQHWRYAGDNIRLWMEECLEPCRESAALNEDLRDSYNNWLEDHGYSAVSHKVFLSRFEEHELFSEWKLVLTRSSRYGSLKMCTWSDPRKSKSVGYTPRRFESGVVSHVKYVKFSS